MKLTNKLLGFLNRVFKKDPGAAMALRLQYDGDMKWTVADGVLSTVVQGGTGLPLRIELREHTISTLISHLASRPGYSVPVFTSDAGMLGLNARALLDGSKSIATSNGDLIEAYTSVLWAWIEPVAYEVGVTRDAIALAPREMSVPTADEEWLDELGNYYAVDRLQGELDHEYATRMIATVGRPLGNNVAMEAAINIITGGLQADVVDVPEQAFTIPHAGTSFCLFDVVYSMSLDGDEDFSTYIARVRAVVEAYRDAGTHMRSITATGGLADTYPVTTAASEALVLAVGVDPVEVFQLEGRRHDGAYRRNGTLANGDPSTPTTFGNSGEALVIRMVIDGVVQGLEEI